MSCLVLQNPIGAIDLKRCITDEVGLVSRDVCARPNTFELLTVHRQQAGDCDTLVTTCYDTLSATKYVRRNSKFLSCVNMC